jgi:hypothetical protein
MDAIHRCHSNLVIISTQLMKRHSFGTATRIITRGYVRVLVFNATFNNISVILWQSVSH